MLHSLYCRMAVVFAALVALTWSTASARAADDSLPRLVLIGDSTVKNGSGRGDGGLWGWGQVLAENFDTSRIQVENFARGGRSSRSYLTEGLWDEALARLRPGDFVLMQFGHNDGGDKFKGDRPRASIKGNGDETEEGIVEMTGKTEVVHSFGWYLRKYIADAKAKGATPIVLSLVPRDRWQQGRVIRSNRDYAKWAAEAAGQGGAFFIDLNELVAQRLEQIGEEKVGRELFTEQDWTHTTLAGAKVNAACVVAGIRSLSDCKLKDYLKPADQQPADSPTSWNFDFRKAVAEHAVGVSPDKRYDPASGFGFEPGSAVRATDTSCVGDRPFYFSARLAEGNYRVKILGGSEPLTVKAELRRLMSENGSASSSRDPHWTEFTVNIRTPQLPTGKRVGLKPREMQDELRAWDDKLTLEFNGPHPEVSQIEIEPEPKAITVFLAGDSTVCDQPNEPWNSWGQMLPRFFKPGVAVANHAESGESLRSSLGARRFDKIFSLTKPGDYLFLQFGHNDMKDKSVSALATYRTNLIGLVKKAQSAQAHPVLVTSMERKRGGQYLSLGGYPRTVREVARELHVPLIDLNAMSRELYDALGDDLDHAFQDSTHHTSYGSYLLAKCVVQGIRENELPLSDWIVDDFMGFDPQEPEPFSSFTVVPSPAVSLVKPAGN